jgi:hypothetical protein
MNLLALQTIMVDPEHGRVVGDTNQEVATLGVEKSGNRLPYCVGDEPGTEASRGSRACVRRARAAPEPGPLAAPTSELQAPKVRLRGIPVVVVSAFGFSASCGTDERAGRNQPESIEQPEAGTDTMSVQDASADSDDEPSPTDSMAADATLCEATPAPTLDAGDPPSNCIPPCIWNAIRNCFLKDPRARENAWCRQCARLVSASYCDYLVDWLA